METAKPYSLEDDVFESIESIRSKVLRQMRNVTFLGVSGNVTIDVEGDRIADYALLDQIDPDSGLFEVALRYYGATKTYETINTIHWPNGKRPRDLPKCGFDGASCKSKRSLVDIRLF